MTRCPVYGEHVARPVGPATGCGGAVYLGRGEFCRLMEQVELVLTVVNEVDALVAGLHCQSEQGPRPLWRTARVEEHPVHLLAFRCRFRDLAVVAVDCEDVAVRGNCEAERAVKEVTR